MNEYILEIKNLDMHFKNSLGDKIQILFNINLSVKKGEFIGIIGESGSGKTQTLMSILKLSPKNSIVNGSIFFRNKDLLKLDEDELNKIRGNYISIALQDVSLSLNPYMKVKEQLIEPLVLHYGKSTSDAEKEVIDVLNILKIPNASKNINKYPNEFSGGQRQRFLIAMALICKPNIFLADELTTSLDLATQLDVLNYIKKLKEETGMAVLFISHDIKMLSKYADKMVVMYCGHIIEEANKDDFLNNTMHPYSKGLIDLTPDLNSKNTKLKTIPGEIPQMKELGKGCPFYNRCTRCVSKCIDCKANLEDVNGHKVACFNRL